MLLAANDYVDLNNSLFNYVNLVNVFSYRYEQLALVFLVGVQIVDDVIEDSVCVYDVIEEGHLFDGHLNKPHVFVFVVEDAFFDVLEDEGVLVNDLLEVFLDKFTNSAVFVSYYRRCGQAVIDKRNFAKELALAYNLLIGRI